MPAVSSIRAGLIELFKRHTPLDKDNSKEVYLNGENNLYPNEIERVIQNSPTGARSASILSKFIAGRGVTDLSGNVLKYQDLPVVNRKHGYKITDIIYQSAESQAKQSGVFIHVGYSVDIQTGGFIKSDITVLDYMQCRIGKSDDDNNAGKIYVKDYEKKKKFGAKDDARWYYPFNDDPKVIREQIKADAGEKVYNPEDIAKYRGQVLYLNLTPQYRYALSRFDSVYNDMDSEYRISLYTNNETRTGFLGKTIIVTSGLDEETAKTVKEDISEFMGADGSGNMWHLDVPMADDITKVVYTQQLKSQFDENLFDKVRKHLKTNILGAANNIPEELVYTSSSVFDGGAGKYVELKTFYNEQTEQDRQMLERALQRLGQPYKIVPIVEPQNNQNALPKQ